MGNESRVRGLGEVIAGPGSEGQGSEGQVSGGGCKCSTFNFRHFDCSPGFGFAEAQANS